MHRQVGSIAMIAQIPAFDLAVKETRIFQSQISASATFESIWMLRREPSSLSAIYF